MDFYGDGSVTELSVNDVFENEVQSEVNEILRSDSAQFSPRAQSTDLSALQTTTLDLDSTEFTLLPNYFHEQAVQTTAQDANPTSVLTTTANTVDLSQITGMDGVENNIHSLLVDPQTGMPVSTSTLQLDPNSAQASLQMIVNSLPELQAQIAASSAETLGLSSIGNIISQSPILSLNTQQQQESPLILSTMSTGSQSGNQNLTFQNGTLQATDLSQINLSNFNELAAQTLISQIQQQQLHLANGNVQNGSDLNSALKLQQQKGSVHPASPKAKVEKVYPKPAYSYSCLITMALKNSQTGCLPVSEIYQFMCENFPYFKTAPDGWKNSVRHNLSLNKCFAKIEKPQVNNSNGSARKGCLWAMNPEKQAKMEEEVYKWTQKDPSGIKRSMAKPEEFSRIEALSRITTASSPKPSQRESTPPVATVPPPLQSIISTATTTTVTASDTKHETTHNTVFAEQFFNPSLNLLDPTLTQLDGDLGLQDNLLDTFNDISSLDVPMTTSPFTAFSFSGPILDSSPLKDSTHTVSSAYLLDSPQSHTASSLQFCSPTRAPQVTAFM
ncbi:uncharacterized protein LOC129263917 [Lytechinus pictus]|uniref:uncharacterized protein LOC129263917 n=1 Tax=Lytechinus pictus TaxID=7653 RepID=UPI0030BA0B5F